MSQILDQLQAALGPDVVRPGDDAPARNRADAIRRPEASPHGLLLPRTTQDVSTALRLCHAAAQPVVVQGGMTGLAAGAHPDFGEVAISLERMSGIEEIDTASGTLTALAGTPLQLIQEAADREGFFYGVDIGARGSCTIGGTVATNAGGNRVLRYGMTRQNVLGLEAVLADGTVLSGLNKMLKNNAGYDLNQILIGTEGTLGIVTRAVLRLHPKPAGLATALCAVPDVGAALGALRVLERELPGGLVAFEGLWREMMGLATGACGLDRPFGEEHELLLLVEAVGAEADEDLAEVLGRLMEEGAVADALLAQSEAQRTRFWAYRESPYGYRTHFPALATFDVSVPRGSIGAAVAVLRERIGQAFPAAIPAIFGHIADSNLHVTVVSPDPEPLTGLDAIVYRTVAEHAGSISAEHGIGRSKVGFLPLSRRPEEIALMERLKLALDPKRILNRGRVLGV